MGIDTSWKAIIREEFGWPGMTTEAAAGVTVVLDDFSLNIRGVLTGIGSWAALGERLRNRVMVYAAGGRLAEYRVMWDEGAFVPPNKGVTQRLRAARLRAEPFTEAEQAALTIGTGPIPEPEALFFERLIGTRAMHAQLHAFVAAELATTPVPAGMRLVLDGARARGIMGRQLAGDPVLLMNVRVPENAFQVLSDREQARIDSPARIVVTRSVAADGANSVFVNDSSRIGESDLKIAAAIAEQEDGAQVFVRSCDTDMLVILLLHMKGFLDSGKAEGARQIRILQPIPSGPQRHIGVGERAEYCS